MQKSQMENLLEKDDHTVGNKTKMSSNYRYDSSTSNLTTDHNPTTFRKSRNWNDRIGIGFLTITLLAIILGLAIGIPLSKRDTDQNTGGGSSDYQKAVQLLNNYPLIDGHNDLPWQFRQFVNNSVYSVNLAQDTRTIWPNDTPIDDTSFPYIPPQTDIPRLRQGKVAAQWWVAFATCATLEKDAVRQGIDQVDVVHQIIDKYSDFVLVTTSQGITDAFATSDKKIASLIALEGGHMIGNSLGNLRMFYKLGVRYMTLTHSCDTAWADSYKADTTNPPSTRGLTEFGKEVVREMNRLGMIIDLSHTGSYTQKHAMQTSRAPVIFSHSSVFTLCNHYRNVNDEILNMTRDNGGIVMINFYTKYLDCYPSNQTAANVATIADHIEYVKNYIGIDYVGIGADYDGVDLLPIGVEDVSKFPDVFAELIRRGWPDADLIKLAGGNFLRVFRKVEEVRDSLSNQNPNDSHIDPSERLNMNCTTGY